MTSVRTITVKVDDKLRKRMAQVTINWSRFVRQAISERIEREERRKAAQELLNDLHVRKHPVPKGFVNEAVRETRKTR
jgi:post-segregation antitoxin (ccd killing protein)